MKVLNKPILYVEANCPRCREVRVFLDSLGVDFEIRDVSANNGNMDAMVSISEQTKVPTFEYEDLVIADFSIDEFLAELREFPEISQKLGIDSNQD